MIINQILKFASVALLSFVVACENNVNENRSSGAYPLPHFKMTLTDSLTRVCSWDGKELWPSIFIYFDPECEHCKQTIEVLLKQMKRFKEVNIYMLGLSSFQKLREFEKHYQLDKYGNVLIAKDTELSYAYKYQGNRIPLIVVYNSHRQLISVFRDSTGIGNILMALKQPQN